LNDAFWASLVFKAMIIKSNFNVFIHAQQRRDDPHSTPIGSKRFGAVLSLEWGRSMEMVEVGEVEDVMTNRENGWNCHKGTLCRNVSCNEVTDWFCYWFCREGYAEYVKQWENAIAKCSRVLAGLEHNLGYPGG